MSCSNCSVTVACKNDSRLGGSKPGPKNCILTSTEKHTSQYFLLPLRKALRPLTVEPLKVTSERVTLFIPAWKYAGWSIDITLITKITTLCNCKKFRQPFCQLCLHQTSANQGPDSRFNQYSRVLNENDQTRITNKPGPIAERSNLLDHGRGDPSSNPGEGCHGEFELR